MVITEVFKDEVEIIKKGIASIQSENCIERYAQYLERYTDSTGLEREYITELKRNSFKFLKGMIRKSYEKLSKEEILNKLMDKIDDSDCSLETNLYDNGFVEVAEWYFNDSDMYEGIVVEMNRALEFVLIVHTNSKKAIGIMNIKNDIQKIDKSIERDKKNIEVSNAEKYKLNQFLADLESEIKVQSDKTVQ